MIFNLFLLMLLSSEITSDRADNDMFDETNSEEYCISEIFQPKCTDDAVIIIQEAIFGRKNFNRCLKNEQTGLNFDDPKVIGCYSDVRSIIDPLCSLKRFCDVRVIDLNVDAPCYNYLKYYMEVKWSCIRVAKENHQCKVSISEGKQNLLSPVTANSQCGNKIQPWTIETHPGQQIQIQLLPYQNTISINQDDNLSIFFSNSFSHASCHVIGRIDDKYGHKETRICLGKENSINEIFFTSNTSSLEIFLHSYEQLENTKLRYIISLEATGCSDLIPPADAWLKRTENEATIGCYSTRLRWQLKCVGQRWIGVIGNCSKDSLKILNFDVKSSIGITKSENQIVVIAVIITFGMVLCFMIACLGMVLLKRYYALKKVKDFNQGVNHYDTRFTSTINKDINGSNMDGHFMKDVKAIDYDPRQLDHDIIKGGKYYELDKLTE